MALSQIADELTFDGAKVNGKGTFKRDDEVVKTFWVRVCQLDHAGGGAITIAEGSVNGPSTAVFRGPPDNSWMLDLPVTQGQLHAGEATASAVLVFEAGGDLFTLSWSECVHLASAGSSP